MALPTVVLLDDDIEVTERVAHLFSAWANGRYSVQAFNSDEHAADFVSRSEHLVIAYIQDLCRCANADGLDGLEFWANTIRTATPRARTLFYSWQLENFRGTYCMQQLQPYVNELVHFLSKGDFYHKLPDHFDWLVSGPGRMTVFLSHSHADKRFVRSLAKTLESSGISVWIDEAEIKVGESLTRKLAESINKVDLVVAVISNASIESEWVQRELDLAMNREIADRVVRVLPVVLDDCDLPGFLNGKLYADFRDKKNRKRAQGTLIKAILAYLYPRKA